MVIPKTGLQKQRLLKMSSDYIRVLFLNRGIVANIPISLYTVYGNFYARYSVLIQEGRMTFA
jgi:hypothetical protein